MDEPVRLSYTIHSCSGYTSTFQPHHILTDNPSDQSSRWTALNTKQPTAAAAAASSPASSSSASNNSLSATNPHADDRANTNGGAAAAGARPSTSGSKRSRDIQYITLELEQPAIVTAIGFGKYHKVHPCNLHEFSVYGGMSSDLSCMEPLLHAGLKNDSQPEQFKLPTDAAAPPGKPSAVLPSKFIRIDALTPHTQNYNVSIWHVWLMGLTNDIDAALVAYDTVRVFPRSCVAQRPGSDRIAPCPQYRSATTTHLVLSHLRRSALLPTFQSLLNSIPPSVASLFEHPLLSQLHDTIVVRGDFVGAERLLEEAKTQDLFQEWTPGGGKGVSVVRWERLNDVQYSNLPPQPRARAGHQMVRIGRKLLLFGGFDGKEDLADLWTAELPSPEEDMPILSWRLIDSGEEEGKLDGASSTDRRLWPRKRSCHQMAVDEREGWVYMLGSRVTREDEEAFAERKAQQAGGNAENGDAMEVEHHGEGNGFSSWDGKSVYASDFWRYKFVGTDKGKWELISEDTATQGGPKLLFDHQMFLHSESQRLFVFGGRIQPPDEEDALEDRYSGLYCFDIVENKWSHLFGDPTSNDTFRAERLLGRIGHSMFFDAHSHTLYILGGQRGDAYLADLWAIKFVAPNAADLDLDEPASGASDDTSFWRAGAVIAGVSTATPVTTIGNPTLSTRSPTILQVMQKNDDVSLPSPLDGSVGPSPSFTHRTTIDPTTREWTTMTGLVKYHQARKETPSNEVWTYTTTNGPSKWGKLEQRGEKPPPRFAASVVYDPLRKEHYLFGGNPFKGTEERLGDLWRGRVFHPCPDEALRMARFLVRKQRFTEMCQTRPTLIALQYLQDSIGQVVDHTDEDEASAFRACMIAVLSAPPRNNCEVDMNVENDPSAASPTNSTTTSVDENPVVLGGELYTKRHELFENLLGFVPASEAQPKEDLKDVATQMKRDRM
ncbi:BQ5605_C025g10006 [Microbotryum silenes-dioicae]|uniref:BQ5605_C025g10006 protein n=1 Tax=Microbotryum silenes-dioicae TaxID=796604 RepID=A0A2X0MM96_9BASI|nr:BQ5605_C025g10006 [Microbotryum silenes-dioicae]